MPPGAAEAVQRNADARLEAEFTGFLKHAQRGRVLGTVDEFGLPHGPDQGRRVVVAVRNQRVYAQEIPREVVAEPRLREIAEQKLLLLLLYQWQVDGVAPMSETMVAR